jgi:lysylphosphatidylglycerol synthetase-like protein (DUF2156 family)
MVSQSTRYDAVFANMERIMAGRAAAIVGGIASFVIYVVAAIWLLLIAYAQMNCSQVPWLGTQCHDERGDVWMLPFFSAPIGLPAFVISVVLLIVRARRRRSP